MGVSSSNDIALNFDNYRLQCIMHAEHSVPLQLIYTALGAVKDVDNSMQQPRPATQRVRYIFQEAQGDAFHASYPGRFPIHEGQCVVSRVLNQALDPFPPPPHRGRTKSVDVGSAPSSSFKLRTVSHARTLHSSATPCARVLTKDGTKSFSPLPERSVGKWGWQGRFSSPTIEHEDR